MLLGCLALLMPAATFAADEEHPYEAASTGYFRDQDTLPGGFNLYRQDEKARLWGGPVAGNIKRSSFQADAHLGVRGYKTRSCVSCHEEQRYSLHSSRGQTSCVQCHRDKPIAGLYHYYSSMNPIRRHAYVCAKCHEGANASFATYVIHEPRPLVGDTAESFPLFYYAVWFMVILTVGVFVIFIPYVALWGIRELVGLFSKGGPHG
jgi:hypothetical protein